MKSVYEYDAAPPAFPRARNRGKSAAPKLGSDISSNKSDFSDILSVVKQPREGERKIFLKTKIKEPSYHGVSPEKIFLRRKIFPRIGAPLFVEKLF